MKVTKLERHGDEMIKIAICEDNLHDRTKLRSYIDAYNQKAQIDCTIDEYESSEAFLEQAKDEFYHLIFLDIYMSYLTGIELAKHIRTYNDKVIIVFVTSAVEHALEGYKIHAYDYLVKPLQQLDLNYTLTDVYKHIRAHLLQNQENLLLFPTTEGEIKLSLNQILYIESNVRKTTIHLEDAFYICNYSIRVIEEKLEPIGFIRTHRSFIVNSKKIKQVKSAEVILDNGQSIFLSKYKQKEVKARFMDNIGGSV